MILGSPRGILRETEADGEEVLCVRLDARLFQIESEFFRRPGLKIAYGNIATLDLLSVFFQDPCSANKAQVEEIVLVADAHFSIGKVNGFNLDAGVRLLYFAQSRMDSAVRKNQAIGAEIVVVWLVAKIAAVSPEVFSITSLFADALVDPIPDEASMRPLRGFEEVPILLKIPRAISHRVRVLDLKERAALAVALVVTLNFLRLCVHWRERVAMHAVVRLVDDEKLWMMCIRPLLGCGKVGAPSCFVAHGEADYRSTEERRG